jgi:hypothetical protein
MSSFLRRARMVSTEDELVVKSIFVAEFITFTHSVATSPLALKHSS